MTDRVAFYLGAAVLAAALLDLIGNGGSAILFLARKLADLIYFLSFWHH